MRALLVLALLCSGCFLFARDAPPPAPPPVQAPAPQPPAEPAAEPEPEQPAPAAPAPAPVLHVTLHATDRLNPDEHGAPLPTQVLLVQLKSGDKLDSAAADDVYRQPKDALGEELLKTEEVWLAPGQVQTRTLERIDAARAFGVIAIVRRPEGPGWRSIVTLPPQGQTAELSFVVDGYRVDRE